jgi:mono/diheme cytochrome c family protein
MRGRLTLVAIAFACAVTPAQAASAPAELYAQHCASCHGEGRLGAMAPALLPESLERLKPSEAEATIRDGRPATRMPPFGTTIDPQDVAALVRWIYSPTPTPPTWSEGDIRASLAVHFPAGSLPDRPARAYQGVDLMNLFIVVEAGDHHATILDGDRLEPLHRFATRYALHGGPKFSPDGRFVYFASRDGWLSKYDLWNLETVTEVRAGINTRNLAVSADGRWVMVANYLPHSLVLFDAELRLQRVYAAQPLQGGPGSRVSAVYDAAPRRSFVVALKDVPEIWEISYDPGAAPIYDGLVHDYAQGEAIGLPGFLNPRRTMLTEAMDDFFFDASYANVMGASRAGTAQVVNLDVRRKIADLDLPGMPHLGSGIAWQRQGHAVMATPNLNRGVVSIIDMQNWRTLKQIETPGPGFFIRSHESSRFAWVDSMMGPERDVLTVLDKDTLEPVAHLRPAPGKTLAHVEFTRDGRYALASLWERADRGGAIIVFDARTLAEVKRIPMDKPVGKYNVSNKLSRSPGTSH